MTPASSPRRRARCTTITTTNITRPTKPWARNQRKSPLYDQLAGLGAEFGEKNGWERVNFSAGESSRQAADDQHKWAGAARRITT